MSLLLTRHVDQYGVDIRKCVRRRVRVERQRPALLEPLANQVPMKTITLDDENALHGRRHP
jgi:hypothetical protein